ncbi:Protein unc-13-like protein C [Frankliniella fusca]|uniref:Protein unc-13-like protein C n=1 Tax=Frankliniella fusca TaxID=407009 RepID=A0AAE1LF82_9NEOP|nr:Protein unc-13-like protein C [Frankliniella fusca]KAK3928590.1 Protein unc-13-like protein C [Frankliniella fusca]KAK3929013.1 Protein unc-13-like protein C [Frankliniella fusca]
MTRSKQKLSEMDRNDLEEIVKKAVAAATKPLQDTIGHLSEQVNELKSELEKKDIVIKQMQDHYEDRLDELEQYGRRNNLRIFGVEEKENENTNDLVIQVSNEMGVCITNSCIDRSHRVGRRGQGAHPRPIIVKFTSYAYRNTIFMNKRKLKGTKITVREDLTRTRLQLLKDAASSYSVQNVWSLDGVVMVNVGLRRPARLKCQEDLNALLSKHPPNEHD